MTQKEKIMKNLGVSAEEADEILMADKQIDRGERMAFDLDPAKEKMAKKMANTHTRTVYNFDTKNRKRKENPTKANIVAELARFLAENSENACENVEITNKERQISFSVGSEKFELTLVQKRKKKD
jgi:hypothetical protein